MRAFKRAFVKNCKKVNMEKIQVSSSVVEELLLSKKKWEDDYLADRTEAVLGKMQKGELEEVPTDGFLRLLSKWEGVTRLGRWEKDVENMGEVWGKEAGVWGVEVEAVRSLLEEQIEAAVVDFDEVGKDVKIGVERSLENWDKAWQKKLETDLVELVSNWEQRYGKEITIRCLTRVLLGQYYFSEKIARRELRGRLIRDVLSSSLFGEEYKQELVDVLGGKDLFGYFSSWYTSKNDSEWDGLSGMMRSGNSVEETVKIYSAILVPAIKHAGPHLKARGLTVGRWEERFVTGEWEKFLSDQLQNGWRMRMSEKELTRCLWRLESWDVINMVRPDLRGASGGWYLNGELAVWLTSYYKNVFKRGLFSRNDVEKLTTWGVEAGLVARESGADDDWLKRVERDGVKAWMRLDARNVIDYWQSVGQGAENYLWKYYGYGFNAKARQVLGPLLRLAWSQLERGPWPLKLASEKGRTYNNEGGYRDNDRFWLADKGRRLVEQLLVIEGLCFEGGDVEKERMEVLEENIRMAVRWSNLMGEPRRNRRELKVYKRQPGKVVWGMMLWDVVKGKGVEDESDPTKFKPVDLPSDEDEAVKQWRGSLIDRMEEEKKKRVEKRKEPFVYSGDYS